MDDYENRSTNEDDRISSWCRGAIDVATPILVGLESSSR